ncbi:MAG: hypothetical protein NVSMB14_11600 [Isosphaeraceae bacterium]
MSDGIARSAALSRPEHLDEWFETRGYLVESPNESHSAYNVRRMTSPKTGERLVIAYKTDRRIAETSAMFLETYSVLTDTIAKPGWAKDSRMDAFVVYSPQSAYFWFLRSSVVRERLSDWEARLESRRVRNDGYDTEGLIVPESELRSAGATRHIVVTRRSKDRPTARDDGRPTSSAGTTNENVGRKNV